MIKINSKINRKLLQNFPQDPYSDITIVTKNYRLQLVLAYLSIDSVYFEKIDPDTKQIDLTQLTQQPLMRVLKSLYGGELESNSVDDLTQLYHIINYLAIDDYKTTITEEILRSTTLMDSLEMLEFSFSFNIIVDKFKNHHFVTQLKLLQNHKNYLQLNKVTPNTINHLLLEYEQAVGEESHQTINNVLQNYLNRNSFAPAQYFDSQLDILKNIWEKFHHSIQYVEKIKAERVKNSMIFMDPKESTNVTIQQKNIRISQLEKQLQAKDRLIERLTQQNALLKQQLRSTSQGSIVQSITTRKTFNQQSLLSTIGDNMKKSYLPKDFINVEMSGEFQTSTIDQPYELYRRHTGDIKELKTMNRLNSRSKKIFN